MLHEKQVGLGWTRLEHRGGGCPQWYGHDEAKDLAPADAHIDMVRKSIKRYIAKWLVATFEQQCYGPSTGTIYFKKYMLIC